MSAAGPATAYVTGAAPEQRRILAAMIRERLAGFELLSGDAVVHVKKSTHLYVVDDVALSGGPGSDKPAEFELEPAWPWLKPQRTRAEETAVDILLGLDAMFATPVPGLPPFLWPNAGRRFTRSAPGRLVSAGRPNHWFIAYELTMQSPEGRTNGIRGSFVEFRLVPLASGGWRLMLLHIRFPLLGKPLETNLFRLPGGSGGRPDEGKKEQKPSNPLTLPAIPPFRRLIIGAWKAAPEAKGQAEKIAAAVPPPIHYVLPVEGSNLLAPYYAFAGEEGERFAPATSLSAIILIEQKRPGGMILMKAAVAPSTGAPWSFAWHYAGMEKGRPNNPVQSMATGPTLLLPEGLYDVDLLVTRTVRTGRPETGGTATIVLRTRRMVSSAHAIVEVAPEQAATIVHSHGERETAAAPGDDGPSDHHHA